MYLYFQRADSFYSQSVGGTWHCSTLDGELQFYNYTVLCLFSYLNKKSQKQIKSITIVRRFGDLIGPKLFFKSQIVCAFYGEENHQCKKSFSSMKFVFSVTRDKDSCENILLFQKCAIMFANSLKRGIEAAALCRLG